MKTIPYRLGFHTPAMLFVAATLMGQPSATNAPPDSPRHYAAPKKPKRPHPEHPPHPRGGPPGQVITNRHDLKKPNPKLDTEAQSPR